ncbi:hypothetical protein J7T55_000598 [Diaporthe amygdali]|uniref:uncharacterized protein n=1 Tax=Phomopsis amygdali TaxID=1214568 RepID=UPI0022FE08B2|nr:uncharacterized protein J7T55_000598 [Diaporthe amygdali]KAJ0110166.1 hypothetical protein J7T55_000598 [Diaporthe amygdali]
MEFDDTEGPCVLHATSSSQPYAPSKRASLPNSQTVHEFGHGHIAAPCTCCSSDNPCIAQEQLVTTVDSGSDIDEVCLYYANRGRWQTDSLFDDEAYVMLANNELVELAGYDETLLGIRGGCMQERFYYPDGPLCDVMLGNPTIATVDCFNEFKESHVDSFHMIQWVEKIDSIEQETKQILAGSSGPPLARGPTSGPRKTSWRSRFGKEFREETSSVDKRGKSIFV